MRALSVLFSKYGTVVAVFLAIAATLLMRNWVKNAPEPKPVTPVRITVWVVNHVLYGHGCPKWSLDQETMQCCFETGWSVRMEIRCVSTDTVLSTEMVEGLPDDESQFEVLRRCGECQVIRWKPAGFVFGTRGLKIEQMSRDPAQIIELMCTKPENLSPQKPHPGDPEALREPKMTNDDPEDGK